MNLKIKKTRWLQIVLVTAAFVGLYHNTIYKLVHDWSIDPNFSHGFLIPFVALYMIWSRRKKLADTQIYTSNAGLLLVAFGMFTHVVGNIGAELFTMRVSMIFTLAGILVYFLGFKAFKIIMVPVLYLLIMIPIPSIIWNKIAFPLQLFAAQISSVFIDLIGIPVFREGNVLHLANTSLEVVDACSGLRSLTSLMALTGAFAYLAPMSIIKKWILFLCAFPIAVIVNIFRLTVTAAMAAWIGPETAHGFMHDMSGLIIFVLALVLVYIVFVIELKIENKRKDSK